MSWCHLCRAETGMWTDIPISEKPLCDHLGIVPFAGQDCHSWEGCYGIGLQVSPEPLGAGSHTSVSNLSQANTHPEFSLDRLSTQDY